jgi:hypothetical protein
MDKPVKVSVFGNLKAYTLFWPEVYPVPFKNYSKRLRNAFHITRIGARLCYYCCRVLALYACGIKSEHCS